MADLQRRKILAACALAPVGIALAANSSPAAFAASDTSPSAAPKQWPKQTGTVASRRFPNCDVTTQDGKKVKFYDDLIKGRAVMINFFYAECHKFCPRMTANLLKVQQILGDKVGRDVFMYSLSLKPEEDTPQNLKHYAEAHNVRPGWTFLTGSTRDMEELRVKLGFRDSLPELDRDLDQHTGMVLFGNDKIDRWTACPALTNPQELARELSWVEG